MSKHIIEVEAGTVEEARTMIKSQIPEGLYWLSEAVISDGEPKTASAVADTIEAAFAKTQSELPTEATVIEKKIVTQPGHRVIRVEAFEEPSAKAQVQTKIGDTEIVRSLKLIAPGRKGFLGVGKTAHQFEAEVFQQAETAITYRQKAKVSAEIGTGKKTVAIVTRDFLLAKKDEILAAGENARIFGMGRASAFSPLEFYDVIRNLVNSNFSQAQVQKALQHPNGLTRRLAQEFLAEVKRWC